MGFGDDLGSLWSLSAGAAVALLVIIIILSVVLCAVSSIICYKWGIRRQRRRFTRGPRVRGRRSGGNNTPDEYSDPRDTNEFAGQAGGIDAANQAERLRGGDVHHDLVLWGKKQKPLLHAPKSGQGDYIGEYEVFKRIGTGQFGDVFMVKKDADGSAFALKRIHCHEGATSQLAMREINVLSRLRHPHVIGYIDAFEEDGAEDVRSICIVMEFCEYGALKNILERKRLKLSEEGVMVWLAQLVEALGYIHQRDVVHRDLKPDNIFVTENYDLKIGDFGVATLLSPDHHETQTAAGTPVYMAPEVLSNETYGTPADVWSLGCVLYRIVAGKELASVVSLDVASGKLKTMLANVRKDYSSDIHDFIKMMLKVEPSERPTIEDLKNNPVFMAWELILFYASKRFMERDRFLPPTIIPALAKFLTDDRQSLRQETRHNAFSVLAHLLSRAGEQHELRCNQVTRFVPAMMRFIPTLPADQQTAGLSVILIVLDAAQANVHSLCEEKSDGMDMVCRYLDGTQALKTLTALGILKQTLMLETPAQVERNQTTLYRAGIVDKLVELLEHESGPITCAAAHVLFLTIENVARVLQHLARRDTCSFVSTLHDPYRHRLWVCRTCGFSEDDRRGGVCFACAETCHRGHDILPLGGKIHFCMCGSSQARMMCRCLNYQESQHSFVNTSIQNLTVMRDTVIPFILRAIPHLDSDSVSDTECLGVYLRLLFACTYDNKANKIQFHSDNGVDVLVDACLPKAANHPEATVLALKVLASNTCKNSTALAQFSKQRVTMLISMLDDRTDPALPAHTLRLLEYIICTGTGTFKSKVVNMNVLGRLRDAIERLRLHPYASDDLLEQLNLQRGDIRAQTEDFDVFRSPESLAGSYNESPRPSKKKFSRKPVKRSATTTSSRDGSNTMRRFRRRSYTHNGTDTSTGTTSNEGTNTTSEKTPVEDGGPSARGAYGPPARGEKSAGSAGGRGTTDAAGKTGGKAGAGADHASRDSGGPGLQRTSSRVLVPTPEKARLDTSTDEEDVDGDLDNEEDAEDEDG